MWSNNDGSIIFYYLILFSYIKKTKYLCSRTIYGDTLFIDLYILQSGI